MTSATFVANASFVAILTAQIATAQIATAQITVDRFDPPAVSIGDTATIRAEGKLPEWPVELWCDRGDVTVTAGEEEGALNVQVADDAPPGVAWIRLAGSKSASTLRPILLEPASVVVETEPNDDPRKPQPVSHPAVVTGRLQKRGDVDAYAVSLAAGDTLIASLVANQVLKSPMDGVLQIADSKGNVLAQADDDRGLDPQLVYHTEIDREVTVRLFAFPETATSSIGFAGDATFVYALRLTTGMFLDHVEPIVTGTEPDEVRPIGWNLPEKFEWNRPATDGLSVPTWSIAAALGVGPLPSLDPDAINVRSSDAESTVVADSLPFVFTGRAMTDGQIDRVAFDAAGGEKYRVRSVARGLGYLYDSVIRVLDSDGKKIAEKDDLSRTDFDASLDFSVKEDTRVELQILDAVDGSGPRHAFGVHVHAVKPSVTLNVAANQFSLSAGESLEIPISIDRQDGFSGRLAIRAEGLPDGVEADESISEAKGDTAKSVKLKLRAVKDASHRGPFRIVASVAEETADSGADGPDDTGAEQVPVASEEFIATYPIAGEITVEDLWLTVAPK